MGRPTSGRGLISGLRLGLLAGLLAACPAAGAEFDKVVPVRPPTRLDVRQFGGEVVVRSWGRNDVRVRATHFQSDRIDVESKEHVLSVRARATLGAPHAIDLTLDVPAWMPVSVVGTYVDVSVTGTAAAVSAETVRGDVRVKGGRDRLTLKTIEGQVILEDAEGTAILTAANNGIRVSGFAGDLQATSVNGSVRLERVVSRSVEAGTVDGDISWTGALAGGGHYRFGTHGGDVDVALTGTVDAAVTVRAFDGRFSSPLAPPGAGPWRKRTGFVLGTGSSSLDLETFRGSMTLRRPEA
jgi:hypothetical protein